MSSTTDETPKVDPRLEEIVELYRSTLSTALPTGGELSVCPGGVKAVSQWALTDLDMEKKVAFERAHFSSASAGDTFAFRCIEAAKELNESILFSVPSRGKRCLRAVAKEVTKGEKKKEFIEIWDSKTRLGVYDVETADLHGKILNKGDLRTVTWSTDETKFMFAAEKKVPKPESFFSRKPAPGSEPGTQYRWKEDWGEQMDESTTPVLVVLKVAGMKAQVVDMEDHSLGQAVFTPDAKDVVCTAMANKPLRLGSIFCNNRQQRIVHYDLETKAFRDISDTDKCAYMPKFNGTGDKLVYMQNAIGGPHQMGAELILVDWKSLTKRVLVPVQQDPKEDEFPGIYWPGVPRHCMSSDGSKMYLTSPWHSRNVILQIDLESGKVANASPDETFGNWELYSVHGDLLLASRSSPSVEKHIVIGKVAANGEVKWTPVTDVTTHDDIKWGIIKLRPKLHPDAFFEAVYIHNGKSHPLIVFPHGGPHSSSPAAYLLTIHYLLKCGYGVLLVNYRGSIGFGEKNLRSLPGNVGDFDVKDVQQAAEAAKAKGLAIKTVVFGGSHGGFLAGHLVGQYPTAYAAACLWNPVIDLSMLGPSDIPDWYWIEGGCKEPFALEVLPSDADLAVLRKCSPIAHASKIVAPCLFFLGTKDLRVDKGHGLKLYKHLKGRGVPAECHMYEDNHALGKVVHASDVWVNAVRWFDKVCRDLYTPTAL